MGAGSGFAVLDISLSSPFPSRACELAFGRQEKGCAAIDLILEVLKVLAAVTRELRLYCRVIIRIGHEDLVLAFIGYLKQFYRGGSRHVYL